MARTNMIFFLIACGLFFNLKVHAQTSLKTETDLKLMNPKPDKALVYFLRPSVYGAARKIEIQIEQQYLGTLKSKDFIYVQLNPGTYNIIGSLDKKDPFTLNVESDTIYFVEVALKSGFSRVHNEFEIYTEEIDARKQLGKCKLSKKFKAWD